MVTCDVLQVHAAIWLVGLSSILAPAGKLSPKGHCLRILVIFEKERSQASLYSVALQNLTDTLVLNTCRHWRRCWSLRELHESYSKALESHSARTRQSPPWPATSYLLKSPGVPFCKNKTEYTIVSQLLTQKPWSPILWEKDRVHHGQPLSIAQNYTLLWGHCRQAKDCHYSNMNTTHYTCCAELSH